MADLYRHVTRILVSAGYRKVAGGKGSHGKWENDILGRKLIVPRNLKSKFTAQGILKSAGLPDKL